MRYWIGDLKITFLINVSDKWSNFATKIFYFLLCIIGCDVSKMPKSSCIKWKYRRSGNYYRVASLLQVHQFHISLATNRLRAKKNIQTQIIKLLRKMCTFLILFPFCSFLSSFGCLFSEGPGAESRSGIDGGSGTVGLLSRSLK